MSPFPDYSAAYLVLRTAGGEQGFGLVFTVGRFVSIRCANSTIVAMITDVTCEDLPSSDAYIASAGVDLLGEILGGPERPKFQRGVTNYPTIGDAVEQRGRATQLQLIPAHVRNGQVALLGKTLDTAG